MVGVATLKKIELAKKFSELKRSGKLEKFVERKRKRNARRDRKHLPFAKYWGSETNPSECLFHVI